MIKVELNNKNVGQIGSRANSRSTKRNWYQSQPKLGYLGAKHGGNYNTANVEYHTSNY